MKANLWIYCYVRWGIVYSVLAVMVLFWNYFIAEAVLLFKGIYNNTQTIS
jgi:hypothetical protein